MRIAEVIGERVRIRREELGLTQAALGQRVGDYLSQEWSRQAVSAAEKGKRAFAAAELVVFARVLGVTISYLMRPPLGTELVEVAPGATTTAQELHNVVIPWREGADDAAKNYSETFGVMVDDLLGLRRSLDKAIGSVEAHAAAILALDAAKAGAEVTGDGREAG